MPGSESRLEQRIRRDFPWPGSAHGVLRLLAGLPRRAGYDEEILASERVRAAVVLLAGGDPGRLRLVLDLAVTDWRDLLVAAGLANEDWPAVLDRELGPPPPPPARCAFDPLEFSPSYSCQADPGPPGDGERGFPVHAFGRDGTQAGQQSGSRHGSPLIAQFTPAAGTAWIGMFEAGAGQVYGLLACPHPLAALAISGGQPYLVDVADPARTMAIPPDPVTHARSAGPGLLILASPATLTAIGRRGQAWASERLCLDSLKITAASTVGIDCLGDFPDGVEALTVDASTGTLRQGRRFGDNRPGQ